MNRKALQIIVILVALATVVILVVYFLKFSKKDSQVPAVIQTNQGNESAEKIQENGDVAQPVQPIAEKTLSPQRSTGDDLMRVASSFAERFGSYSSHSSFSNMVDLEIFMSDNMKKWSENYVSSARSKDSANQAYYGITTNSISEEVVGVDETAGRAEILVKTQRKESSDTVDNSSIFYQDIALVFIKERNAWKVDSATWKAK